MPSTNILNQRVDTSSNLVIATSTLVSNNAGDDFQLDVTLIHPRQTQKYIPSTAKKALVPPRQADNDHHMHTRSKKGAFKLKLYTAITIPSKPTTYIQACKSLEWV